MSNPATTINENAFATRIDNDIIEAREIMKKYQEEFFDAIMNEEKTHSFYVGHNLPLTLAVMREFSGIYRLEQDYDNGMIIVHFDEFED